MAARSGPAPASSIVTSAVPGPGGDFTTPATTRHDSGLYASMRTISPADLAAALAQDPDTAFPDLVRTLQDGVFPGALRMVGNRHDAEEIAQEAFLRAYRALRQYPAARIRELNPGAWVWTSAANLCRTHPRTRSRRPVTTELSVEPAATGRGPESEALDHDLGDHLVAELSRPSWPVRSAAVLVGTGIVDGYVRRSSVLGDLLVAFGSKGVTAVELAGDPSGFVTTYEQRFGRKAIPADR